MTFLLWVVLAVYAVSLAFVVVLFSRALLHERKKPISRIAEAAGEIEREATSDLRPVTKTA